MKEQSHGPRIGIQLFQVGDALSEDPPGTLARLAEIGFEGVELHGVDVVPGPLEDFRALLSEDGLEPIAIHVDLDELDQPADVIHVAESLGTGSIVFLAEYRDDVEGYRETGVRAARAAQSLAERGIALYFHPEVQDFRQLEDGRTGVGVVLDHAPRLRLQPDTFWIYEAGADVLRFLGSMPNGSDLIHLKDHAGTRSSPDRLDDWYELAAGQTREVGRGILPFGEIFERFPRWRWVIVEQDVCPGNGLESAEISFGSLRSLLDVT